jgi:HAD superfamily hydrolase (TIGR01484 family)
MKPLIELTSNDLKNIKIICFDCDGVTVERGTEIEETEDSLTVKTHALSPNLLEKMLLLKKRFHLTFSSGRSLLYLDRMYGKILWDNASLQGEIGIFALIDGQVIQQEKFTLEELNKIRQIKETIRELSKNNKDIRGFEPKQFLITPHCWNAVPEIEEIVKKYDSNNNFYCWWNGEAYDIAPKRLNKGSSLNKLAEYLGFDISQTMAIGNGINDKDMIDAAGISVTTDPKELEADYFTSGKLNLGGEELVDRLLELIK